MSRRAWQVRKVRKSGIEDDDPNMTAPAEIVYADTELEARTYGSKQLSKYPGTLEVTEVESFIPDDAELEKRRREAEEEVAHAEAVANDPILDDYYVT